MFSLLHRFRTVNRAVRWLRWSTPGRVDLWPEYIHYYRCCENWRALMAARRDNRKPLAEFRLRSGLRLRFDPLDAVSVSIFVFRVIWFEQAYTRFLGTFTPQLIVDVGAHFGFFSCYAASRWQHSEVVALEPNPTNYTLLLENVRQNRLANVRCIKCAVAGTNGTAQMGIERRSDSHALIQYKPEFTGERTITVNTIDLPSLLNSLQGRHIDLLKLDCESAEFGILAGQAERLRESVRYVTLEYHEWGGKRKETLVNELTQAGFSVRFKADTILGQGMLWASPQSH